MAGKEDITDIIKHNWSLSTRDSSTKDLYILSLLQLTDQSIPVSPVEMFLNNLLNHDVGMGTTTGRFISEFAFNMNPRSLGLDEPFATQIVPTQKGGQFIERQGIIYKNIAISGTTGLRPNYKAPGAIIPVLGVQLADDSLDPDSGLPQGERSGYEDFMNLRNLFRAYGVLSGSPDAARYLLVWQNGKEGEYYIVEPISFRTSRDSSTRVTFNYDIQLRTISRYNPAKSNVPDSYKNKAASFTDRLNRIRRKLISSFQIATALIDRTSAFIQQSITAVLSPTNDIIEGLTGIATAGARALTIPRSTVATLVTSAVNLADNISTIPSNIYTSQGIITDLESVANAFNNIARTAAELFAETDLFAQSPSVSFTNYGGLYVDPVTGAPNTGGDPTFPGNTQVGNGASQARINDNENIFGIAKRLLGNSARWKDLVVINKLKAPYISPDGDGVSVLRPGDSILVPSSDSSGFSAVFPKDQTFRNISAANDQLGRDLKLVATQALAGISLFDVGVSVRGDLDHIEGPDNLIQAVVIKFATEQGTLPTHPFFGQPSVIGTKARVQTIVQFQLSARSTLLSDNRISAVNALRVSLQGNAMKVKGSAVVRNSNQSLPLNFSVQQG